MARHAQLLLSMWRDGDFRALTIDAQWLYLRLLAEPRRNMIGLIPYRPRAWTSLAVGARLEDIAKAVDELAALRFVLVDEDTDELLIRTMVKHDPPRNPSATTGMWRQWEAVESPRLRAAVLAEIPVKVWLANPADIPPEAHELRGHSL